MSFVTGLFLIDTPASALNNMGTPRGSSDDNVVAVKAIRARDGLYPYVSAQAFRYWLRTTLQDNVDGWQAAPIYREEKVAYTDANPLVYWDDDLFGYMRAPSTKNSAKELRAADVSRANETPTGDTITRVSPFRVSTLVSIAPVSITEDFGTMSRHEGNPVPHEHQFYRTTLKGLFSLDLNASGTFTYQQKTGFRNLDEERIKRAQQQGLTQVDGQKAYRLPEGERVTRISALFRGLAQLEGGAKQTLHYTDVAPTLVVMAVTKGGNHIFNRVIGANGRGLPELKGDALEEALTVFKSDILSDVYVGWVRGYLDEERSKLEAFAQANTIPRIQIGHPREMYQAFINDLANPANRNWLD